MTESLRATHFAVSIETHPFDWIEVMAGANSSLTPTVRSTFALMLRSVPMAILRSIGCGLDAPRLLRRW